MAGAWADIGGTTVVQASRASTAAPTRFDVGLNLGMMRSGRGDGYEYVDNP